MGLRRIIRKAIWKLIVTEKPALNNIDDMYQCYPTMKVIAQLNPTIKDIADQSWYFLNGTYDNLISKRAKLYAPYHIFYSRVGAYTYIAINSRISETNIGRFCSIGPNLLCGYGIHPTNGLSTSPMFYSTMRQNGFSLSKTNKIQERKRIHIGNDVFIGANVTILDGVTIGDGAIIGAGAVVSKDIPPYAVAVGCPIQIIKYRFEPHIIEELLRIKWWYMNQHQLKLVEKYFNDPEAFIQAVKDLKVK